MCPFDPGSGAGARPDWHALRVSFRKGFQRLLDGNLGAGVCLHCWICVRNSNWVPGGRDGAEFCLLASNDSEGNANSAPLIRAAVAAALSAHPRTAAPYDLNLIDTFIRGLVHPNSILLPLTYQRNLFGIACLDLKPGGRHPEYCHDKLCADLIYHVRRYQFSCLIQQQHRKDLILIGTSGSLREQDIFIERASQAELPVLILGEKGCESEYIARALHMAGRRMNGPFSLCDCLAGDCGDQDSFEAAMRKAQGGSLFLENVDALPFKGQVALSQLLSRSKAEDTIRARVLASSSHDIHQAAQRQELYAPLLRHLDFLSTVLAPLRCRRGDIRSMCEFFWTEYSGTEDMALSQTAADSLEAFHWPGNVEQLEKVMAKLVVLRKGAQIEALDLQRYAPEVLPPTPANALHNSLNAPRKSNGSEVQLSAPTVKEHAWLAIGSDLSRCHPGVRKAVDYLVKNYSHRVTLGKVAGHACVSPSHLCVLLRRNLGMNFKTLLLFLRVEKAKDLFAGRPELRVTDVSLEVGFSDLGHFEKVFRKFTGCSPSAYRRRLRGAEETTEVPTHGTSHNRFAAAS